MDRKAEGPGYPWPQDMERRRVTALQRFQRNNPQYKQFMNEESHGTNWNRIVGGECGGQSLAKRRRRLRRSSWPESDKTGGEKPLENRWCLATTLELLEQMKAYVRANNFHCIGEDAEKWTAIATHLTNPRGLELTRFARSCMVRFDNLRRFYRVGWVARMEVEVQDSLLDYFQICEQLKPPGSSKTLPVKPSTMTLALNHKRAQEAILHGQTATQGREILHDGDCDAVSSADDYSGNSSDDEPL